MTLPTEHLQPPTLQQHSFPNWNYKYLAPSDHIRRLESPQAAQGAKAQLE